MLYVFQNINIFVYTKLQVSVEKRYLETWKKKKSRKKDAYMRIKIEKSQKTKKNWSTFFCKTKALDSVTLRCR